MKSEKVKNDAPTLKIAREYLSRGWSVVPVPYKTKRAVMKGWKQLRLREADLPEFFDQPANIGIILGDASRCLVDVDLDCDEARQLASKYLPATDAKTGRPGYANSHWWYYAPDAVTCKHTDRKINKMMVELRSNGCQTVVGPSVHPDGTTYEILRGEPTCVPAPMLTACVDALAKRILEIRYGDNLPAESATPKPVQPTVDRREIEPHKIESRALAYLDQIPPAISGQGGHNTTYTAATALVHGFEIEPERALELLLTHFNPRCDPPWTEKELRHKVEDAATKNHARPRGWLLQQSDQPHDDVDLSGIVQKAILTTGTQIHVVSTPDEPPESNDPGPIPTKLLRVPGFISEVMDHSLETAPYPNQPLAFCGALALQAFLAGRKVRDQSDNRTNLYLLGLAYSASGKDWPRKVNMRIAHAVGLSQALGENFASGEGLQDALFLTSSMLFQTDEIDGLLQSINKSKDARHEGILSTLLTMYSSANSVVPMRRKAGQESSGTIEQPCLVILGTAIPTQYYAALSERMLTNGFFARMLIVEADKRGSGQEPGIINPSTRIMETAAHWSNFQPGKGNLEKFFPIPKIVEYTPQATSILIDARLACEAEYTQAESKGDPVGTTVWGRTNEHIRKLALLYAISVNHLKPSIDVQAASWATRFAMHQTRRMLFMAQSHVAENPFHAECLKVLKKLREAPDHTIPHQVLLKRMKTDAQTFQKIIETLRQRGEIELVTIKTATKSGIAYRLVV